MVGEVALAATQGRLQTKILGGGNFKTAKSFQKWELIDDSMFLTHINLIVDEKLKNIFAKARAFKAKFVLKKLNSYLSSYILWKTTANKQIVMRFVGFKYRFEK